MALDAPSPPRIIVELLPDGTIAIEQYINGARHRTAVPPGVERLYILEALADARREIDAKIRRQEAAKAAEDAARHRRIYWTSVSRPGQGKAFADRVIGAPKTETKPKPKPEAKAESFGRIANAFDLL